MAEPSSPALPGDVEWLPGPGGTRVLRIHPASAAPPALILRVAGGGEQRIDARPQASTEYSIPADVDWSAAWLLWPDGTRASLPLPHGPHAEVIELRPRRFARSEPPVETGWRGELAPRVREELEGRGDAARAPSEADTTAAPSTGDPAGAARAVGSNRHGDPQTPAGVAAPTGPREPGPGPALDTARAPGDLAATAPGEPGESAATAGEPPATAQGGPGDSAALAAGTATAPGGPGDSAALAAGIATVPGGPGDSAALAAGIATVPGGPGDSAALAAGIATVPGGPGDSAALAAGIATVPGGPGDSAALAAGTATAPAEAGDPAAASPPADTTGPGEPRSGASSPDQATAGSWTTPPQHADSTREAEAAWRERRDDLRRELAEAADAIARARDGERSARDAVLTALAAARADVRASRAARAADASALAAVTGELGAERAAHAVTRGSVGSLADALSTARAELAAAKTRAEATQAELEVARAELVAARATGAAELAQVRSEVAQARSETAALREALDAPRPTPGRIDLGRLAAEQAEAAARRSPKTSPQLLANLDAAAAALRAANPAPGETTGRDDAAAALRAANPAPGDDAAAGLRAANPGSGETTGRDDAAAAGPSAANPAGAPTARDDTDAGLRAAHPAGAPTAGETATRAAAHTTPPDDSQAPTADAPGPTTGADSPDATSSKALVGPGDDLRLRRTLLALAREDSVAAGALLVGLLPAQGAVIEGSLTYDLTVRGVGTFAVFAADGSARIVRLSRRRPRSQALFHLSADPVVLAELLAGEREKIGRFHRKAKVSGKRKRARELLLLAQSRLSLADAVKAGARLEPALVYRALPLAVDPEWTRGHSFTVAQQIVEFAPNAWHITARDGRPLRVEQRNAGTRADATVTMSQAAFERMLRDEAPVFGDRPTIRGDRDAVASLKRWTDLARGTT
ncbi:hypothetical protein OM076_28065 [Solirubrobacter ginsenosidimutans]|uniref:Uncharacterized protein n=1 Tax=Solirubrobacter ginsenosidimutans TaxID=490573 RepID=A0A9X3S482_9ACTN|nr:hypothetical protein [Solirubrobacter ginsenosidimutans]MDA0164162.1 hypothetical protein [Solirubrobacter ginsenosidimutans]